MHTKAKSILFMKSAERTTNESRAPQPTTSSIWKAATEQIHISPICWEVSSDEPETTYHAIWSNQCIELWFLLHLSYMQSDLHRTSYWPKLTEILTALGYGEYEKNRTDMYQILFPFMDAAIANAEKLDRINEGKLPSAAAHKRIFFLNANIPSLPSLTKSSGVSGIGCFSLKNSVIRKPQTFT